MESRFFKWLFSFLTIIADTNVMTDDLHASNMQYFLLFMKGRLADAWNGRIDVWFQSLHKPSGHISFYLEFQLEDKTISFEISYFAPCLYIWN